MWPWIRARGDLPLAGSLLHLARHRTAVCGVALAVLASGCREQLEARLVPLFGCGIDDDQLRTLRVEARGDFPVALGRQLLLNEGTGQLPELPSEVAGVTVEAVFGGNIAAVGRTARLHAEGELPVYFSPPDRLCPLASPSVADRQPGAIALGELGDVVIVGGRDSAGDLLDEIVLFRDTSAAPRVVDDRLAIPSTGQTLHAVGGRAFVMVGGFGNDSTALARTWRIDVADAGDRVTLDAGRDIVVSGATDKGRAFHAGAVLPGGQVLVTGGCHQRDEQGACALDVDAVTATAFLIEHPGTEAVRFAPVPPMRTARFGHDLLVARDGVVFAVGGRDDKGRGLRGIEVLLSEGSFWGDYGPPLGLLLDRHGTIESAALLEGSLLLLLTASGVILRVDQNHVEPLREWCDDLEAACFAASDPTLDVFPTLTVLPGERVLAGTFVLPPGLLRLDGTHALDLSVPPEGTVFTPPPPRVGARTLVLDDGSVLLVGGREPSSSQLASPLLLRFRPPLDGPDEGTPSHSNFSGSLVMHNESSRISVSNNTTLLLEPSDAAGVETWAHVRGFRSRHFQMQASIEALRSARPRFVFSRGAVARIELALERDNVTLSVFDAMGNGTRIGCEGEGVAFGGTVDVVRLDVSPKAVVARNTEGTVVGRCPWPDGDPVAVGLGAVGDGTIRVTGLGLDRG